MAYVRSRQYTRSASVFYRTATQGNVPGSLHLGGADVREWQTMRSKCQQKSREDEFMGWALQVGF